MIMGGVVMPLVSGKALAIITRIALSHSIIEHIAEAIRYCGVIGLCSYTLKQAITTKPKTELLVYLLWRAFVV